MTAHSSFQEITVSAARLDPYPLEAVEAELRRDSLHVGVDEFRDAFSRVPTAVAVITTTLDGQPVGTTVGSFCALSATPPLALVALDLESNTLAVIRATRRFAINVLNADQGDIASACATKAACKFDALAWSMHDGLPRLDDTVSWMTCELVDELSGGDHAILSGLLTACESSEARPLVYHLRGYCEPLTSG